jgi:hypothetical protein
MVRQTMCLKAQDEKAAVDALISAQANIDGMLHE